MNSVATLEEEGKNKLGNISHKRRVRHGVVCAGMDLPVLDKAICQQQRRTCSWELDDHHTDCAVLALDSAC